jgi:hypothetical protein
MCSGEKTYMVTKKHILFDCNAAGLDVEHRVIYNCGRANVQSAFIPGYEILVQKTGIQIVAKQPIQQSVTATAANPSK